jgi:hypothetical protein
MTSMPLTFNRVVLMVVESFGSFKRGTPRLNEGPRGALEDR